MTPAEAVAKLREEREQHPYTAWSMASMVLEAEHARLLREAIEMAKKLKAVEETNTRLEGRIRALVGVVLEVACPVCSSRARVLPSGVLVRHMDTGKHEVCTASRGLLVDALAPASDSTANCNPPGAAGCKPEGLAAHQPDPEGQPPRSPDKWSTGKPRTP